MQITIILIPINDFELVEYLKLKLLIYHSINVVRIYDTNWLKIEKKTRNIDNI